MRDPEAEGLAISKGSDDDLLRFHLNRQLLVEGESDMVNSVSPLHRQLDSPL